MRRRTCVTPCQVLVYCAHHRNDELTTTHESEDENCKRATNVSEWDSRFIAVDHDTLFDIILAANYLDIKSLL